MFISFEQLILLLLLAFILFGPEKLPEYAARLGRLVAKLRQASEELTQQVQNRLANPPPSPGAPAQIPGGSTCPHCHGSLDPAFNFCPHCGRHRSETPGSQSLTATPVLRPLTEADADTIYEIINDAAQAYRGVIPADCWKEPYMSREELREEMAAGVVFWGAESYGQVVGVMGRQDLAAVTLIRHSYVRPAAQRQGIGALLLNHLRQGVTKPVLVGTWAAASWAVRFYEKHGFQLVTPEEKDRLLRTYWTVSDRQIETSVVLADERWP